MIGISANSQFIIRSLLFPGNFCISSFADSATADFFRARLDHMIDLRHELAVLSSHMPWQHLEATLAHRLSRQAATGQALPGIDLFGQSIALTPRASNGDALRTVLSAVGFNLRWLLRRIVEKGIALFLRLFVCTDSNHR